MASADQISCRNLGRQSWASAPTGRKGGPINHLGQRSVCVSGRKGWVWGAAEIIPKVSSNLGQSLSQPAADSSLYTREPLGTGDADCRVGPLGLLAMTMVSCHSEERSDVGIRSFLRCTGVRAAEVVGPYGRSTEVPATGRCGHWPLRVVAESHRDCQGSALSAERVAGQIQVLPDN